MDETQRRVLLTLARETIRAHLNEQPLPPLPAIEDEPADFAGAFVTLHNHGRLRGCIGRFNPSGGLAQTVQEMAVAALQDPRFRQWPVTAAEIGDIDIEISVLSPMVRTDDPPSLVPGVHGVFIRKGPYTGCFLPQVATEQRWSAEQLLSQCCAHKAGLPADAWKDPETEVYLFTSEVFGER